MGFADDFLIVIFGVIIMVIIPFSLYSERYDRIKEREISRATDEFKQTVKEEKAVTGESYIELKNELAILDPDHERKVSIISFEAEKGKVMSDHFYILNDDEIREMLLSGYTVPVGNGRMVFVR